MFTSEVQVWKKFVLKEVLSTGNFMKYFLF